LPVNRALEHSGKSMRKNELLEFYKEIYFFEIQRSERFDNRLQVPTAALVVLIGFQAFMFKGVNFGNSPEGIAIFCVGFILSILSTAISIYFLINSWGGSKYQFIPLACTLDDYRKSLMDHYSESECGVETKKLFQQSLIDYYIKCSSFNADVNESRARDLYLGVVFIGLSSLSSILSFIPYFGYDLEIKETTNKIQIVSPIKIIQ
jgi:hypothetical protein